MDANPKVNTMGIRGFPLNCECGRHTVIRTAKTKENPGRPFFRCTSFSDDHLFKWVEDAVYEEVQDVVVKVGRLESEFLKTKGDFCSVNETLMEEVTTAKRQLKALTLMMKLGIVLLFLLIITCVVLIMFDKSNQFNPNPMLMYSGRL